MHVFTKVAIAQKPRGSSTPHVISCVWYFLRPMELANMVGFWCDPIPSRRFWSCSSPKYEVSDPIYPMLYILSYKCYLSYPTYAIYPILHMLSILCYISYPIIARIENRAYHRRHRPTCAAIGDVISINSTE